MLPGVNESVLIDNSSVNENPAGCVLNCSCLGSPVGEHFASGDGTEGLIRGWVDAAGEEMDRTIAKQEVRPFSGVVAVKRIRVKDREVGAGQVRGVAVSKNESLAEVRIIVGRAVGPGGR